MSVVYQSFVGYGFFSKVTDTDWSDPATHERRDLLWEMVPEKYKDPLPKDHWFNEDFDHETLEGRLKTRYPRLGRRN